MVDRVAGLETAPGLEHYRGLEAVLDGPAQTGLDDRACATGIEPAHVATTCVVMRANSSR